MSTGVLANAKLPEELLNQPLNFTAVYNVSVVLDDNSDIRELLKESMGLEYTDMSGDIILANLSNVLTALLDYKGNIKYEGDFSEDFRKMKFSLVSEENLKSTVSTNLKYTVNSKAGLWADVDLSNPEKYKMDIIFLLPTDDKYYYFNAGLFLDSAIVEEIYSVLNFELVKKTSSEFAKGIKGFMSMEQTENGYKCKVTNKNFIDMVNYYLTCLQNIMGEGESFALPENLKILGDAGIHSEYTVKDGIVVRETMVMDIDLDIENLVTTLDGGEWEYTHKGEIDATVTVDSEISKLGSTEVSYPWITESSGICLNAMIEREIEREKNKTYYDEYEPSYPNYYVSVSKESFVTSAGEYYVPLRDALEKAYGSTVIINYYNGGITLYSDHFDKFKSLMMTVGYDRVSADGVEYHIGEVVLVDGVTYVNAKLFTEIFGWELTYANHNLLHDSYQFAFHTREEY